MAAVSAAADLARDRGAKVHVVRAYNQAPGHALAAEAVALSVTDAAEAAGACLDDAAARVRAAGVDVDVHAIPGAAHTALIDVARAHSAEMIVVGNKGMTGGRRFVLGSVPNRVSHHAPCSVLIVRTT